MDTKRCTKCGEEKSLSEYGKDKHNASGLCHQCKECRRLALLAYRTNGIKRSQIKKYTEPSSSPPGTKQCTRCREDKPLSEYHKDKRATDGLYSHCKACHYQMTHAYENSEKGKEVVKKSVEKRKEQIAERTRRWSATPEQRERRRLYAQSEAGKEAQKRKDTKREDRNPEKLVAKRAIRKLVFQGILPAVKSLRCAMCGKRASEYHHESYLPEHHFAVIPLCKRCHALTYTNPL